MTDSITDDGSPGGAWWRQWWLLGAVAAVFAIGIVVGLIVAGGSTSSTVSVTSESTVVTVPPTSSTTTQPATTTTTTTTPVVTVAIPETPNIVFILVDDLRPDEFELGFGRSLDGWTSALETELVDKGTTLENFYITTPLCCPSRASILSGLYAHNHLVFGNTFGPTDGFGGYPKFFEEGFEDRSLGVWMNDAGYRTAMVGKYMNGFPNAGAPAAHLPALYVPPGWDEWYATKFVNRADYFVFSMNENGVQVPYGSEEAPAYLTDAQTVHAVEFIRTAATGDQPFFLYLSPNAPHFPLRVPERHIDAHRNVLLPVPESYGEEDLSDKPQHVVDGATPRTERRWDRVTEQILDMTLPIDEMIAAVVDALESAGVLDETYIFFVSDNGLLRGEHGLGGKGGAYEESILAPLVVRGPGIAQGVTLADLGLNIDLAPTFVELAGAPPVAGLDGESLLGPLLGSSDDPREAVLLELRTSFLDDPRFEDSVNNAQFPTYFAVRTADHLYVEYHTQEAELYDTNADPFQMDNVPLAAADPALVDRLQRLLRGLANCTGVDCALAARGGEIDAPAFNVVCRVFDCTFTAVGSIDEGQHSWSFGDGATATGYQVTHQFTEQRSFEVTLTIEGQVADTRSVLIPRLPG